MRIRIITTVAVIIPPVIFTTIIIIIACILILAMGQYATNPLICNASCTTRVIVGIVFRSCMWHPKCHCEKARLETVSFQLETHCDCNCSRRLMSIGWLVISYCGVPFVCLFFIPSSSPRKNGHERAHGQIKYMNRKCRHGSKPANAFTKNFRDRSPWHQTCVYNWFDMPGCDEQMPYYDYCFYCFKAVSPLQGRYRDRWPLFTNSSLSLYF